MMKTSDRIAAPSRADVDDALSGLARVLGHQPSGDVVDFLTALAFSCDEGRIDFAFAVSHTSNETDFYRDADFTQDRNPAGICHPDNAQGGIVFASFRAGARFYVGELLLKLRRPIPAGLADARMFAPGKWDQVKALVESGGFPTVATIADLNKRFGPNNREAVWMTDESGPSSIVAKGNALFPDLKSQTGGTVTQFSTPIPGLPGGPLLTDYPIRVDLIGISERQRPGRKAGKPRRSVQHGNGNPDSSAQGERNFLHGLVGSATWISYHATADDKELWVLVPLDEVTFQAADGAGPGNEHGYSCEMVEDAALWANPSRRDRVIHVCADFMGRCAARLDVHTGPEQHFDFNWGECCDSPCDVLCGNRHDCPDKLRHVTIGGRLAWDLYAEQWNAARIDELRRMGGTVEPPPPTYATPHPPKLKANKPYPHVDTNGSTWLVLTPRRWKALKPTERKQFATDDAAEVGPPIPAGNVVSLIYSVTAPSGAWLVSKGGSRVRADAFVPAE